MGLSSNMHKLSSWWRSRLARKKGVYEVRQCHLFLRLLTTASTLASCSRISRVKFVIAWNL
jgi:hypothetical protein